MNSAKYYDPPTHVSSASVKSYTSDTSGLSQSYQNAQAAGKLSGPLKADGTPDYRYKENRVSG